MHTAICTFDNRDDAERARERLLQAGFDRDDVHLQHRGPTTSDAMGEDPRAWAGSEREIAVGPRVLESIGLFFGHLLGERHPHADTYARHVEGGRTVLVVDALDSGEVQRAHDLLRGLQATDLQTVHRPTQRPLREIVGMRGGEAAVTAERPAGATRDAGWSERGEEQRERALAAGDMGEQRPLDLRDPDEAQQADKPNRDGLGRTRREG